jgi:hypothetical protein
LPSILQNNIFIPKIPSKNAQQIKERRTPKPSHGGFRRPLPWWIRLTQKDLSLVGVHLKQLRRVFNPISHEELAKILSPVLDTAFGLTEGQTVIAKGHFRIDGSERTQTPYL